MNARACCLRMTTRGHGRASKNTGTECEVVGAVEDGRSLLAACGRLKPDIILLDISCPC